MAREAPYYIGRVLKFGALNDAELLEALRDPVTVSRGQFLYTVTQYQAHRDEAGIEYHSGRLAKFRPSGEVGVVEPEWHAERTEDIANLLEAASSFVFLPEFSAVAYQHVWNQIERDRFRSLWSELIREKYEGLFRSCEVEPITDLRAFVKRIAALNRIQKLDATVHPPNPLFGPAWVSLTRYLRDRRLQEVTVKETARDPEGIESGIIQIARAATDRPEGDGIADPELLSAVGRSVGDAAVLMAVDGYGKARIEGMEGQERKIIRTYEAQHGFRAPSDAPPNVLYEQARHILLAINDDRYLEH